MLFLALLFNSNVLALICKVINYSPKIIMRRKVWGIIFCKLSFHSHSRFQLFNNLIRLIFTLFGSLSDLITNLSRIHLNFSTKTFLLLAIFTLNECFWLSRLDVKLYLFRTSSHSFHFVSSSKLNIQTTEKLSHKSIIEHFHLMAEFLLKLITSEWW